MSKEEIILTSYGRTNSEIRIKCCDEMMKFKSLPSKHWNDNPFIVQCSKCRTRYKGNQRNFESPKIHTEWRLTKVSKARKPK